MWRKQKKQLNLLFQTQIKQTSTKTMTPVHSETSAPVLRCLSHSSWTNCSRCPRCPAGHRPRLSGLFRAGHCLVQIHSWVFLVVFCFCTVLENSSDTRPRFLTLSNTIRGGTRAKRKGFCS